MRIYELKMADELIIAISIKNEYMEFKSVVVGKDKKNIYIEPIRVNEKVVNFYNSHARLDLLSIRDGKPPIQWKLVNLKIAVFEGKICYVIETASVGTEVNRRNTFRMYVGIDGVAQLGSNRKAENVIVKDISESGFSFVSKQNLEEFKNIPVRLVFSDDADKFSLMGIVVRKDTVNEEKNVYGCILNSKNYLLGRYIATKQREKLAKHYSNVSDKKVDAAHQMKAELERDEKRKAGNAVQASKPLNQIDKHERRGYFHR